MRSLSAVCSELLEDNGLTLEDIDLFIPHQANLRIIEAVGDRLKLESEKIFVNLDEYGNKMCIRDSSLPNAPNSWAA